MNQLMKSKALSKKAMPRSNYHFEKDRGGINFPPFSMAILRDGIIYNVWVR